MRVRVLYFAAVREIAGLVEEEIELASGGTIDALATTLVARHPPLGPRLAAIRFARNERFVRGGEPLAEGDVIALIPPVAGG